MEKLGRGSQKTQVDGQVKNGGSSWSLNTGSDGDDDDDDDLQVR